MRSRLLLTALLVAAAASPPALAQQSQEVGGIPTETQRRLARADSGQIPWDLLGLFGLLGLLGLRREHPEDSYHPAPLE
jgi:hypothetical protein